MGKINFTKEHFEKMKTLAVDMLLNNESVTTKMCQVLNISELLHTTTISTLNNIRLSLAKKIEDAESKDEWVSDASDSKYLDLLRRQKELVNLIIGWKRWTLEQNEMASLKKQLKKTLADLKESQKTPEDKIKELEAQLAELETTEF